MTFKVTKTSTKPDGTDWFLYGNGEVRAELEKVSSELEGKLLSTEVTTDESTQTITRIFIDESAYAEFLDKIASNDIISKVTDVRTKYDANYGITTETITETI